MTTSVDQTLTQIEQVFKDLVWDPMIKAGESWLEVNVPFFALPVIKQVEEETVKLATDALYKQIVLIVDVTAIRLKNSAHQSAYESASIAVVIAAQTNGVESPEYAKAKEDALAALSKFAAINK